MEIAIFKRCHLNSLIDIPDFQKNLPNEIKLFTTEFNLLKFLRYGIEYSSD